MKRAYAASKYARPYERYCRERFPGEAEQIFQRAEGFYRQFIKEMPDLGKNMMAQNMLDWFPILSFYEASNRRLDGEALLAIKRRLKISGRFGPYSLEPFSCPFRWTCITRPIRGRARCSRQKNSPSGEPLERPKKWLLGKKVFPTANFPSRFSSA